MTKVAIIGNGQQGGSIALALVHSGQGYEVATYDASAEARTGFAERLTKQDAIQMHDDIAEAVKDADIVVLATPIDTFGNLVTEISSHIKDDAVITDIGSGKVKAISQIEAAMPAKAQYIPAHPVVGKSVNGPENADEKMYESQTIAVVPQSQDKQTAQALVEKMWTDMGGNVTHMKADVHDRLYGTISHFTHVLAFSIMASSAPEEEISWNYKHAGNSILDTTRIANASPTMWLPIFKDNKVAVLEAARTFQSHLDAFKDALEAKTPEKLEELFEKARDFRKNIQNDKLKESLVAEAGDWTAKFKSERNGPQNEFNEEAYTGFAFTTGLAALLAGPMALTAKDMETKLGGIEIAKVANPSFKDVTAPALSNPAFLAHMLHAHRKDLLARLEGFEVSFETMVKEIRHDKTEDLRNRIERVAVLRGQMPPEKPEKDLRQNYLRPAAEF